MALIPLALKGVTYRAAGAASVLRRNLLIYGLGGIVVPFVGIKAIDLAVTATRPGLGAQSMQHIRPAIVMLVLMTLLTGLLYPLGFTALAQALFPHQAAGSLIDAERQGDRLGTDRPATSPAPNISMAAPPPPAMAMTPPIPPAPTMPPPPRS